MAATSRSPVSRSAVRNVTDSFGRIGSPLEASKNGRRKKIDNDACLPHVAGANPSTALYTLRQLRVVTIWATR